MDEVIEHEEHGHRGTFSITRDGRRIAEMTYQQDQRIAGRH